MELHFSKSECSCLNKVMCHTQSQEQTQEVKLTEAMPDIGRVLTCRGQVMIRSKEWRSNGIGVSGGVMAWVLYVPEDGSELRSVEAWIPFQMKWDLPETERDGTICVMPLLKNVDARSVSARKLIVRANVSVMAKAMEPIEAEIYQPEQLPEDIQLLRRSYPVEIPKEAGEKLFHMEEELNVPGTYPPVARILSFHLMPEISDQRVMADKLVFRGKAGLHMLYASEDGAVHSWDSEIPFSQYADLDAEYGPNAQGWVIVVPTSVELDKGEQCIYLKAAFTAQYLIFDRVILDMVEDAYSNIRAVQPNTQQLRLPVRLDSCRETVRAAQSAELQADRILDAVCCFDHPVRRQNGDLLELELPGCFQLLYVDGNGDMQASTVRVEEKWQLPSDAGNDTDACTLHMGQPLISFDGREVTLSTELQVTSDVFASGGMDMVSGLEVGEVKEKDNARPSLILRRTGEQRLWDIAKECGSTVEAIRSANHLLEEPDAEQMLLIPVS